MLLRADHSEVSGGFGLLVRYQLHSLTLHAREHVLTDGHGEGRGTVLEPLRHHLNGTPAAIKSVGAGPESPPRGGYRALSAGRSHLIDYRHVVVVMVRG